MLITPLADHETAIYMIIAPMTDLKQHVAGEMPLNQPMTAITKKTSTAEVIAIERIDFCTFALLWLAVYFKVILQRVGFGRTLERRFQLKILSRQARRSQPGRFHRTLRRANGLYFFLSCYIYRV